MSAAKANAIKPGDRLYLIDGSGYIFRAFHALPPLTRKSDGLPVGAVAGFCNMLFKLMRDTKGPERPTHLAVIFDTSRVTFRNEIYADYKAHRPPPPDDLIPQFALIRDATRAFGVPAIELDGYEADDLIGAYACAAAKAGASAASVGACKGDAKSAQCAISLTYDDGKEKPVTWTDTAVVVSTDKGWRVDDIGYGGTWDFGNKGKLGDTLKAVIAESAASTK